MDYVKLNYSELEKISSGLAINEIGSLSSSSLLTLIDTIQSDIHSALDTVRDQKGESINVLEENLEDMIDSLRGIENNSEKLIENVSRYYDNMSDVFSAKDEEKYIHVSEDISKIIKNTNSSHSEYESVLRNINFILSGMGENRFFIENAEEKKNLIIKADTLITSTNVNVSSILNGVNTKFNDILESMEKLEEWIDVDKHMKWTNLAIGIGKVVVMAAITVAVGPYVGIALGFAVAAGKAWSNGKSGTEAVVVGAVDAAVGHFLGKGAEKIGNGAKTVINKLPIDEFGTQVSRVASETISEVGERTKLARSGLGDALKNKTNAATNSITNTIDNITKSKAAITIVDKTKKGITIRSNINSKIGTEIENSKVYLKLKINDANHSITDNLIKLAESSGQYTDEELEILTESARATEESVSDAILKNINEGVAENIENLTKNLSFADGMKTFATGVVTDPVKGIKLDIDGSSLEEVHEKLDELEQITAQMYGELDA